MISKATALLPPEHQDAFRKSVANVINTWGYTTSDGEVRDLLRVLLSKHGVSIGECREENAASSMAAKCTLGAIGSSQT
jgi:hypothetical protein